MSQLNNLHLDDSVRELPGELGLDAFAAKITRGKLSTSFREFCIAYGGGYLSSKSSWFVPDRSSIQYWELCDGRFTDAGGQIDVTILYGVTEDERFDIEKRTSNTHRVWRLPGDFWVIASDGVGRNLVSRLIDGADEVFLWEPHVEPHFFQISTSLLAFYIALGPVPDDAYSDD